MPSWSNRETRLQQCTCCTCIQLGTAGGTKDNDSMMDMSTNDANQTHEDVNGWDGARYMGTVLEPLNSITFLQAEMQCVTD